MGRSPLEPLEALHALTTCLPSVAPSLGLRKLANPAVVMSLLRKALLTLLSQRRSSTGMMRWACDHRLMGEYASYSLANLAMGDLMIVRVDWGGYTAVHHAAPRGAPVARARRQPAHGFDEHGPAHGLDEHGLDERRAARGSHFV